MKRIYLFLFIVISLNFVSCYEDPFYKLNVFVVDQELNVVEGADIIISVQDDLGEIVEDATVYQTSTTNIDGLAKFEFKNLGFFSIQAQKIISEPNNIICGNSSVSLEENTTKEITILATESNCN